MAENLKNPPAKKTIEDPPEYSAATDNGENVQLEDPAEIPMDGAEALASDKRRESGDWLGGPQNGEEATYQQNGQQVVVPTGTGDQAKKTAGTKDWLGGPQNGADEDHRLGGRQNGAETPGSKESGPTGSGKAQGEGARNPQTGEGYARNPQTGE